VTVIVGKPRIEVDKGREEETGRPRELAWFLDLPGQDQVTPPKWHPWLVLRELDIEDEAELRFVQTHEAAVRVGENGGKQSSSDTRMGNWLGYPV
jgi:hypothetical protein